jgi:uncharacterized membrane protein YdjX (TVP38/TMEM64 family)
MSKPDLKRILSIAAFPLLFALLLTPILLFRHEIWGVLGSGPRFRAWISGWGPWAPVVFLGVQVLQVVVFVIPGEIPQIAGGWLFGFWKGGLLTVAGIAIGSAICFFLARLLGVPFVQALFPPAQVEKMKKVLSSPGSSLAFFLLFLIPGIPKDVLCYVAGVSPMKFPFFLGASMLGRLPGIVGSALIGGAAAGRQWVLMIIIAAAALALFVTGFLLRPRIQGWIEKMSVERGKRPPEA